MARSKSSKGASVRRNPNPYRKAQRRRTSAKRMRRFEALTPRISIPLPTFPKQLPRLRLRPLPGIFGSGWRWSKLLSLASLSGVIAMIVWIQIDILWYVYSDSVIFNRLTYLQAEELYPATDLEAWNIFWVQPQSVRERIVTHPYVADASVRVQLPNQVIVDIEEAEAVALWVTATGTLWVLEDGAALPMRQREGETAEAQMLDPAGTPLPMIIDAQRGAQVLLNTRIAMDAEILESALSLLQAFPGLSNMRYNEGVGLNFGLPNSSYWVYWGDGHNRETKMDFLQVGYHMLKEGDARGQVIDVRFRDHPVIR